MIIKRLTMNNFGVYAGENTFEFSHTHPVVLIGGMNGRGKTTFLEAILLALYGTNSNAYKESNYKTYGKYLRSYVNKGNWSQSTFVELEFIMNESSRNEYLVRREWDALSKRTAESITVKENGIYSDFLTKNWEMFVENILPSALSNFYFFDGEKIAELAIDGTNVQIKESIRSMLGISVLDVLKNDLGRSLRRISKKANKNLSADALQIIRQELDDSAKHVSRLDNKIAEYSETIAGKQADIDELHHQYEIKGGDVLEQRQSLIQQRSNLLAEIDQNKNALTEIASGELPLVLVRDLIGKIKLQAEDEHNDFIMQQTLEQIEILLEEYSASHREASSANQGFVEFVKEKTFSESTEAIYQVSDHALFQLNALLDSLLTQSKKSAKKILLQKAELQKKLDEVDSYLSLDINEKELSNIFVSIHEHEDALVQLKVELTTIQQERRSINAKLISKTAEFNRTVEAYLHEAEMLDDSDRMAKYSNMALRIVEEYSTELQKRKTGVLGETITSCYKKLANKKNLIQHIVMDSRTLDITYLDENSIEVSKDSLSAGEKQLMVIAILWALAICSKKKLPVIIDTPLSRLDSMHRTSLVTNYFPKASDQTIILSTDSEIDRKYYDMMKDYVGDEFTLDYCEETKSTTIMKGYFQGK